MILLQQESICKLKKISLHESIGYKELHVKALKRFPAQSLEPRINVVIKKKFEAAGSRKYDREERWEDKVMVW